MSLLTFKPGGPSDVEIQWLVKMRAKDETIVSLQTENAMLRLRLAELRASVNTTRLQKDNMRRQFLHAHSNLSKTRRELQCCENTIQSLRFDVDEMRSFVEQFMTMSTASLNRFSQVLAELQKQVLLESESVATSLQQELTAVKDSFSTLQLSYNQEKKRRKALHNTVIELRGNIRVHCRVRPMLPFDQHVGGDNTAAARSSAVSVLEEVVAPSDDETVCVQTLKQQLSGVGISTKHFDFDHVYGPNVQQSDVFKEVQPLLTSLLDGYNVCLMAYGQTGSGKTHSMLGEGLEAGVSSSDIWWHDGRPGNSPGTYPAHCMDHGIIPRAAVEIFRLIEERSVDCNMAVAVSVVEIYNNEIYDLLQGSSTRCDVSFKEDGSVNLIGVSHRDVTTSQQVMQCVLLGLQRRAESATGVHQHSSRSHLIITLHLQSTHGGTGAALTSTATRSSSSMVTPTGHRSVARSLSFDADPTMPHASTPLLSSPRRSPPVSPIRSSSARHQSPHRTPVGSSQRPPAGSSLYHHGAPGEPASTTKSGQQRVINTKLQLVDLAGSECAALSGVAGLGQREASFINRSLSSLADVLTALAKKQQHVPYRNSKLTHVLQDTIGGDAKMMVLTCVAPAQRYLTESLQCLQFGSRIRQVQRGPVSRAKPALSSTKSLTLDSPHQARDRHSSTGRDSPRSSR